MPELQETWKTRKLLSVGVWIGYDTQYSPLSSSRTILDLDSIYAALFVDHLEKWTNGFTTNFRLVFYIIEEPLLFMDEMKHQEIELSFTQMKKGVPVFDRKEPEVVPPYQFKQNPEATKRC